MNYGLIAVKFALGMFCLILQINILGKGNLAPTAAIDQVQNYVLGGIVGWMIYNNNITVLQFIMVLLIWTLIVFIVKFAKEHSNLVQKVIDGQPQLLIHNGQVLVDNCIRTGISANDLMFKLRNQGIYEVNKVKSGVLERNGQLVIIENNEENIKFPLITDGKVNQNILELIHHDDTWLKQQVAQAGYSDVVNIFLGEYVHGQLHLIPYPKY